MRSLYVLCAASCSVAWYLASVTSYRLDSVHWRASTAEWHGQAVRVESSLFSC